jgi:hypothetical protein
MTSCGFRAFCAATVSLLLNPDTDASARLKRFLARTQLIGSVATPDADFLSVP